MRTRKIRGQRRRHKHIEKWRRENLELRHDLIEKYNGDRIDIIVHPWCDTSIIRSAIPFPKRKTKYLMLNGLLDIYESWKTQLDQIGKPYYLKIWIFEPRFSDSQVVCAVSERIDFYENNFYAPEQAKIFNPQKYASLKQRLEKLNWDYRLDENHYGNNEVGQPEQYATRKDYEESVVWFNELMKRPHRTTILKESQDDTTEFYSFKQGDMWIGGNK